MEPGRELDTNVAIHVMKEFNWSTGDYSAIPYYSTDIAAAFAVDKPGWLWEFQESVGVLTVTLYTSPEMWQQAVRDYPIFPRGAILVRREWLDDKAMTYAWLRCLAALEAVGVEVEDG